MGSPPSPPDPGVHLAARLPAFRGRAGMDVAFGGWVAGDGTSFAITDLAGARTGSLHRLLIRRGAGLGGKSLVVGRPMFVENYRQADGITHVYDQAVQQEGLQTVVALPAVVDAVPRAVVYLASRTQLGLGDRWLDGLAPLVRRLERDIAVEEEVRRRLDLLRPSPEPALGRADLHDIAQELTDLADRVEDPALQARLAAVTARLARSTAPAGRPPTAGLTRREVDVLVEIGTGCTNQQAADNLGLLPNTVKSYLKSAMRKLGASNRVQALAAARRAGVDV